MAGVESAAPPIIGQGGCKEADRILGSSGADGLWNRRRRSGMMTPTAPPPPREALAYLRAKGYKIAWDYRDLWKEEHVRAFTVAKAMTQELLMEIRQAVDAALAEGKTFKQFQDELEPLLGKRGWLGKVLMEDGAMVELGTPRRLKILYDTHMRTARAAGQWVRIERNKAALPYLRYGLGPSREHRLQHV